ncbi:MAG: GNAT family N-acetyltransferase [Acholeplasmataceae bacterium]|jgi:ribosomal protein S18 acetylase RimI-like enzyme
MTDLIVNLYEKNYLKETNVQLKNNEIKINRLLSPDADKLVEFVQSNFTEGWASEVKAGVYKENPTCFIASYKGEIIGFACYDATAKSYFGPMGVSPKFRGLNVGQMLLLTTLEAMKYDGYGYAIIGSVGESVQKFYKKHINFIKSETKPNLYNRLIKY